MLFGLFRRPARRHVIERLHGDIVAVVRQPSLYRDYGISDTFEGRFEVLVLATTLVTRRLSQLPEPGPALSQDLTDAVFTGLDDSLRELGISDVAVPKRMKKLAAGFMGRRQAYDQALSESTDEHLQAALARNIHGGSLSPESAEVRRLATYARAVWASLETLPIETFQQGGLVLPAASDVGGRET